MQDKKEVTLSELHDMYIQDPDKMYVIDLQEMVEGKEEPDEKDTGNS